MLCISLSLLWGVTGLNLHPAWLFIQKCASVEQNKGNAKHCVDRLTIKLQNTLQKVEFQHCHVMWMKNCNRLSKPCQQLHLLVQKLHRNTWMILIILFFLCLYLTYLQLSCFSLHIFVFCNCRRSYAKRLTAMLLLRCSTELFCIGTL